MAKRGADKYLTDENWDKDEEEEEEKGEFLMASTDAMSQRTIIKAKRRCKLGGTQSCVESSLFRGFAGFSKPADGAAASTTESSDSSAKDVQSGSFPFPVPSTETMAKQLGRSSDMSKLNKSLLNWINNEVTKDAACDLRPVFTSYSCQVASISMAVGIGTSSAPSTGKSAEKMKADSADGDAPPAGNPIPLSELFKKASDTWDCTVCFVTNKNADAKCLACTATRPAGVVTSTNQTTVSASPSISPHVTSTAITQPATVSSGQPSLAELFKKSADEWECKSCWVRNKSSASECVACNAKNPAGASKAATAASEAETEANSVSSSTTAAATSFSFAPQGGFTFKLPEGATGFSFGSGFGASSSSSSSSSKLGEGFNFKPPEASSSDRGDDEGENEEYVPPKTESVGHTESDAFYSVRCRLFYHKHGIWNKRGLGNLFLKPCGERTQLLIRDDTRLGNILLNVMLTDKMPISRQGPNNVSLACVPNPPIELRKPVDEASTPVCMLIRVETGEVADELFAKINESRSKTAK